VPRTLRRYGGFASLGRRVWRPRESAADTALRTDNPCVEYGREGDERYTDLLSVEAFKPGSSSRGNLEVSELSYSWRNAKGGFHVTTEAPPKGATEVEIFR